MTYIFEVDRATDGFLKCPICGHAGHRFDHFNGKGCEACGADIPLSEVQREYPIALGRYLLEFERESIPSMVSDHGPDWSDFNPVISEEGWRLLKELGPLLTEVLNSGKKAGAR
ncbi:MAG: hypothetical protein JSV14_14875 [Deltaproteobacteria bacterium]|nr:MAG: hypothetical protein JSV14_14875 [Deltaproteobacteria bacterium]